MCNENEGEKAATAPPILLLLLDLDAAGDHLVSMMLISLQAGSRLVTHGHGVMVNGQWSMVMLKSNYLVRKRRK